MSVFMHFIQIAHALIANSMQFILLILGFNAPSVPVMGPRATLLWP